MPFGSKMNFTKQHYSMKPPTAISFNYGQKVGDGAMTLVAFLLATTKLELTSLMQRGWKQRLSVKDVDRSKWEVAISKS